MPGAKRFSYLRACGYAMIKDKQNTGSEYQKLTARVHAKRSRLISRLWYDCGQTKNHRQIGGDFSRNGGPKGIRTLDLSDANRTLSQLSYEPKNHSADLFSQSIIPQFFLFVKPYF